MATTVSILKHCQDNLGENGLAHLDWYDNKRPSKISAREFFHQYAWAVLVSGMSRKSAQGWVDNNDFWTEFSMSSCRSSSLDQLLKRVGAERNTVRGKKLAAIHAMARELDGMSPREVADRYFDGVIETRNLEERHVALLRSLRIPYLGPANAQFILRNLGGEFIKCDRWVEALLRHFKWRICDLEKAATKLGWGLARVDVVLWSYCEDNIRITRNVSKHFRAVGL